MQTESLQSSLLGTCSSIPSINDVSGYISETHLRISRFLNGELQRLAMRSQEIALNICLGLVTVLSLFYHPTFFLVGFSWSLISPDSMNQMMVKVHKVWHAILEKREFVRLGLYVFLAGFVWPQATSCAAFFLGGWQGSQFSAIADEAPSTAATIPAQSMPQVPIWYTTPAFRETQEALAMQWYAPIPIQNAYINQSLRPIQQPA
jgi:hypothetical protein